MLRFDPPRHDPAKFKDLELDPVAGLVQSLRWYNSRASLLLYFWGMHETIETEAKNPVSARPLSPDGLFMLRRTFLHSVVLEVRALHDRDARSLGSCQIAKRLADPVARDGLRAYLTNFPQARVMQDTEVRERYLDYVQRYCSLMAPPKNAAVSLHPLAVKMQLVRRMANKAVAHSTLDDYSLSGDDLADVVLASLVIACAIEAALGDAAIENDFAVLESSSYLAAGYLLQIDTNSSSFNVNMIRGFLPAWVQHGVEFPDYPRDFRPFPQTRE